jgi:dipeptidase D
MSEHTAIQQLEPQPIWKNFLALNAVPRPSKKEERVIAFMKSFGEQFGLETLEDAAGNVIIKKPASAGLEGRPTVILQSHLDMVHQKNADTDFDFDKQGIQMFIDEDWVKAKGTTLGADNGMGVAAAMAVLQSTTLAHPPIEALFTIDEETGMTGAKGLEPGLLDGKIMLNLDTEEDDTISIGCAGGVDTNTYMIYTQESFPGPAEAFELKVKGLKGGHSGMDIHLGRGNANKLMVRLLYQLDARLASFDGGSLRNAIPREATAVVVVKSEGLEAFQAAFESRRQAIIDEYTLVEPGLSISMAPTEAPSLVMELDSQQKVINALYTVHNGVWRMSPAIDGLVETSSSLARVIIEDGEFITQSLQRSALESGKQDVANAIRAAFENIGTRVENNGDYPGWAPNPSSAVLTQIKGIYKDMFGEEPHAQAYHAGLECGIIGSHYPGLDMVSIGPTIRHAHSPDEKVSISSVQKFWRYLTAILAKIR